MTIIKSNNQLLEKDKNSFKETTKVLLFGSNSLVSQSDIYYISIHIFRCNPTQLDPLVKELSNLSDCVDEIVCSTYSPVNIQQLLDKANLLASHLHKILETLKTGISGENEQQWIEFLGVAVEHNLQNLQMKVHVQP